MPSKICLASWISRSVTSSITPTRTPSVHPAAEALGCATSLSVRWSAARARPWSVSPQGSCLRSAHPAIRIAASRQPPSRFPAIACSSRDSVAAPSCAGRPAELIQHRHHLIVRSSAGSRQDEIERDDRACSARRALLPLMSKRPQIGYDTMSLYFRLTLRYAGRIEASR
jgi:hypothetical protein